MTKYKYLIPGFIAVAIATAIGATTISAQESGSNGLTMVQRIAQRFNLNESEVQQVFDEEHAERKAQMRTRLEERLSEAVTEGEITEEQKQAILDKHDEMHNKMEALKDSDLTHKQRHEQMRAFHEEMKAWAEEEGLDMKDLMFIGKGFGKGIRGGRMMGEEPVSVQLN